VCGDALSVGAGVIKSGEPRVWHFHHALNLPDTALLHTRSMAK
jgi:hypothetical protein